MSIVNTDKFPDGSLRADMTDAVLKSEAAALELLKQHRGFARTDEEWYNWHRSENPLVYLAIDYNYTALLKALLDEGSSPNARGAGGNPPHLLLRVLEQDLNEPGRLEQLELLLAHPDCSYCYTTPIVQGTRGTTGGEKKLLALLGPQLFSDTLSPETLERRQRIFVRLLEMIPEEEKKPGGKFALKLLHESINVRRNSTEDQNFMLREMVNHGFGLGKDYLLQDENPLQLGGGGDGNKRKERFAAARAAGMQDDCFLWQNRDNNGTLVGPYITVGAYLESLSRNPSPEWVKFGEGIQTRTREILEAEIEKIRSGDAERILITPQGRASWQAQGLAVHGMLVEALASDKLKGTAPEAHRRLIVRLEEALPPSLRHFSAPLLRDEPLAYPSESATVQYVRGGATEVFPASKA